uniref:Family with sequence similarity 237 member B n=1 Tax=Pavo cristatus TaxID=9049 RepID=A0A8C9EKW5_PAVCR
MFPSIQPIATSTSKSRENEIHDGRITVTLYTFFQVSSWSMEFVWKRRWYLQLGCVLILHLVHANLDYLKEAPASLGQIDHQCWEVSSHGLVEMKKLKVADPVIALWDFMLFLKESPKPKHNELFNDLAQNFWDMYVDCVLSRSHGMGRRQLGLLSPTHFRSKGEDTKIPQQSNVRMKEDKSTAFTVDAETNQLVWFNFLFFFLMLILMETQYIFIH